MPDVIWVGATTPVPVTSTVNSATTPASVQAGDGLFAFVMARSTITPPAGWTLVHSHSVTSATYSITQTLACYQKDTVALADASTAFTWTQAVSSTMIVSYVVVRPADGVSRVRGTAQAAGVDGSFNAVTIPTLGAAQRGQAIYLAAGSTLLQASTSYTNPIPFDYIVWHGGYVGNRLAGCYQVRPEGETNTSRDFVLLSSGSGNSVVGITLRIETSVDEHIEVEQVNVSASQDTSGSIYSAALLGSVSFQSSAITGNQFIDELIDALALTWGTTDTLPALGVAVDNPRITDVAARLRRVPALATSETALSETAVAWYAVLTRDTVRLQPTTAIGMRYGLLMTNAARLADALRAGETLSLSDTMALAEALATVSAVRVAEALRLQPVVAGALTAGVSLAEGLGLIDALRRFLSGDVLETVGMETVTLAPLRAGAAASDAVGIEEAPTETLILRVTAADTMNISPEMALQMFYNPTLVDGVEISAAYLSPGNSITTWAVNAKTGAVSEYDDFEFNSFAASGVKYLGASSAGLYELNGGTDDGADIIGRLKSGFLSFAGSRFSGFRAAYIAVRGPGDYVFRLTTGDDKTYDYAVNVRRMETTKIKMGKGIRSSYFAFELISTGQDFDLDFVEFVPARAGRRV